jgi:hypothetical protein
MDEYEGGQPTFAGSSDDEYEPKDRQEITEPVPHLQPSHGHVDPVTDSDDEVEEDVHPFEEEPDPVQSDEVVHQEVLNEEEGEEGEEEEEAGDLVDQEYQDQAGLPVPTGQEEYQTRQEEQVQTSQEQEEQSDEDDEYDVPTGLEKEIDPPIVTESAVQEKQTLDEQYPSDEDDWTDDEDLGTVEVKTESFKIKNLVQGIENVTLTPQQNRFKEYEAAELVYGCAYRTGDCSVDFCRTAPPVSKFVSGD